MKILPLKQLYIKIHIKVLTLPNSLTEYAQEVEIMNLI